MINKPGQEQQQNSNIIENVWVVTYTCEQVSIRRIKSDLIERITIEFGKKCQCKDRVERNVGQSTL